MIQLKIICIYLEKSHWERVMNFSSFNLIWDCVLADGYVQISVHQTQKLSHHLRTIGSYLLR